MRTKASTKVRNGCEIRPIENVDVPVIAMNLPVPVVVLATVAAGGVGDGHSSKEVRSSSY